MSAKTDPGEFADMAVLLERVEAIEATLARLEGLLEALVAELGVKTPEGNQ